MNSTLNRSSIGFDKKIAERSGKESLYLDQIDVSTATVPRNILVKNNLGNPLTQIDITCNAIRIAGFLVESISVTVDITQVGANGRDEGELRADAWYYLWLVFKDAGDEVAGLLSTNRETPIMPMGYTQKRLIGAVRTKATGALMEFAQVGRDVFYNEGGGSTGIQVLSSGGATTFTDVDCRRLVPVNIAGLLHLNFTVRDNTGDNSAALFVRPNGWTTYDNYFQINCLTGPEVNRLLATTFWMPTEDGVIEYKVSQAGETANLYVVGYQLMLW